MLVLLCCLVIEMGTCTLEILALSFCSINYFAFGETADLLHPFFVTNFKSQNWLFIGRNHRGEGENRIPGEKPLEAECIQSH